MQFFLPALFFWGGGDFFQYLQIWYQQHCRHVIPEPNKNDCIWLYMTRLCMTMHDYVWLCMIIYDYIMTLYNFVWICMTMYHDVWIWKSPYEYVWLCMTLYDYVWLNFDSVWLYTTLYNYRVILGNWYF